MEPQELRRRLSSGVIGFPVTPFNADLSLDIAGLRRNLEAMLSHPFAAVVAPGGTGELYSLTPEEHFQVVRAAVEVSNGRVPVIAGAAFNSSLGAELARQAARAGAHGILAFPPYYPNADEDGLFEYYRAIGEASSLGLLIYSRDWVNPGPSFVERLTRIPTLVAWKDGQGDIRRYQSIMSRLGDRLLWIGGVGDDLVPGYYAIGIRTFTSSISNVAPRLALLLHDLGAKGDSAALDPLMNELVIPLYAMRGRRRGYEVTVMKEMMNLLGMAGGPVRPPLPSLRDTEVAEIQSMLDGWKTWL